ncbi:H-NS histone family protein [Caballeronia glebae]|uniref:H-NS histone family protein n=1 Tax=Caballeronia glebae TaxID=1777143 RepID=UPI000B354476|nr:H-NS histone family protein [Caballeronia glebae]
MAYHSVEIAQLQAQQEALDKQLPEAKEKETQHTLREIVQKMREYGITLNELMGSEPREQPSEPTARYRDPLSGATWSGRGRAPHWIVGKNRDDYLIDKRGTSRAMVEAALFSEERSLD